uniref:Uncharacterized protein n=1 Tax=Meloidogyne enterolobii TaxID=390850 RepID=A0A6V7X7M8_MELEN|nr:unnamed protein product [Meloidogyne enterolobii]
MGYLNVRTVTLLISGPTATGSWKLHWPIEEKSFCFKLGRLFPSLQTRDVRPYIQSTRAGRNQR